MGQKSLTVHHLTFSPSEDEAETLAVSLLQHGGLLLDHVVADTQKNPLISE